MSGIDYVVGDWVENVNAPHLDARRVARVSGDMVWLDLGGAEIGPFPAENYRKGGA